MKNEISKSSWENKIQFEFLPLKETMPSIVYAGIVEYIPDSIYENVHTYYQICVVISGTGSFLLKRKKRFSFKKGDIFVIKSQEKFMIKADEKNPPKYAFIGIDFHKAKKALEKDQLLILKKTLDDAYKTPLPDRFNIALLINKFLEEVRQKKINYLMFAKGYCLQCLSLCVRTVYDRSNSRQQIFSRKEQEVVEKTVKFIKNNYCNKITLQTLADKVFLSPYYFSRIFKKSMGYSPIQYVNIIRIQKAKELLKESDISITEISGKLGFFDVFYFSSLFKRIEGLSPLQYKKALSNFTIL